MCGAYLSWALFSPSSPGIYRIALALFHCCSRHNTLIAGAALHIVAPLEHPSRGAEKTPSLGLQPGGMYGAPNKQRFCFVSVHQKSRVCGSVSCSCSWNKVTAGDIGRQITRCASSCKQASAASLRCCCSRPRRHSLDAFQAERCVFCSTCVCGAHSLILVNIFLGDPLTARKQKTENTTQERTKDVCFVDPGNHGARENSTTRPHGIRVVEACSTPRVLACGTRSLCLDIAHTRRFFLRGG